jgi:threonine/homoserine/homoserine lactone efflux protein
MEAIAEAHGWHAALAGALLGLSLAAPPGPVMSIMATTAAKGRLRESLLTAVGAISADLTWLSLAILGTIAYLGRHPRVVGLLGLGGAGLLLWMAWGTWKAARVGIHGSSIRGSWKLGYLTVLTSPFSFAWWLANGTLLYSSWGSPGIAGMFLALLLYSASFSYAFLWLGTRAASAAVGVAYVSVLMLGGFGFYVTWEALKLLG